MVTNQQQISDQFDSLNSAEQTVFIVDRIKSLPFNLIKLVTTICEDIIERNELVDQNGTTSSTTNSTSGSNESANNYLTNILEEQANDESNLRLYSVQFLKTKLIFFFLFK
jgi:hypothetical protein